jgi:hypothetical protein
MTMTSSTHYLLTPEQTRALCDVLTALQNEAARRAQHMHRRPPSR